MALGWRGSILDFEVVIVVSILDSTVNYEQPFVDVCYRLFVKDHGVDCNLPNVVP